MLSTKTESGATSTDMHQIPGVGDSGKLRIEPLRDYESCLRTPQDDLRPDW